MSETGQLLVITPTLGTSAWLEATVAGVEACAAEIPLDHVLVAPPERVAELRRRWPTATVLAEPEGGVYAAINAAGAARAHPRWLTWINDDDLWLPGILELWRRAEKEPGMADVLYGDVDYVGEHGRRVAAMPVCRRPADVSALLAAGIAPFTQQGTLISAELWRRLGGFDASLRIAGDFDFWVRAAATGARFAYVPETVAAFRIRSGQLSGDVTRAKAEVGTVLSRGDLRIGRGDRAGAITRFRCMNLPRVLRRIFRTGGLRSRALFAR